MAPAGIQMGYLKAPKITLDAVERSDWVPFFIIISFIKVPKKESQSD